MQIHLFILAELESTSHLLVVYLFTETILCTQLKHNSEAAYIKRYILCSSVEFCVF